MSCSKFAKPKETAGQRGSYSVPSAAVTGSMCHRIDIPFYNANEPVLEVKERAYREKMGILLQQKELLMNGNLPAFMEQEQKCEETYRDRLRDIEYSRTYLIQCSEKRMARENSDLQKEFQEKEKEIRDAILAELEEERKYAEYNHAAYDFKKDFVDGCKLNLTRKLRRRPNDPVPAQERRNKKQGILPITLMLTEAEIEEDLALINGGKCGGVGKRPIFETKIEDGKLLYDKKWYLRGQPIYVEGRNEAKFGTNITSIGNDAICVKKPDGSKFKITLSQLIKGKVSIKRRVATH